MIHPIYGTYISKHTVSVVLVLGNPGWKNETHLCADSDIYIKISNQGCNCEKCEEQLES